MVTHPTLPHAILTNARLASASPQEATVTEPDFTSLFNKSSDARGFAAGDIVFSEGDAAHEAWVVLAGELEIMTGDRVLGLAHAGSLVGEMALIDSAPRSATVRCRTSASLVPIDQKRFLFMLTQTPFFAIEVMRLMAARLRATSH